MTTANALGQPIRPPSAADKRRAAAWAPFAKPAPRPTPCLCGSRDYETVDVGDGLERTDCCHAY